MIISLFLHLMYSAPVQSFCERHLIDWDRSDPQTREWLEEQERKEKEIQNEPHP